MAVSTFHFHSTTEYTKSLINDLLIASLPSKERHSHAEKQNILYCLSDYRVSSL